MAAFLYLLSVTMVTFNDPILQDRSHDYTLSYLMAQFSMHHLDNTHLR